MENFCIYAGCWFVLIISWIAFIRQNGIFRYPTIPLIYFLFHSAFIAIGAPGYFILQGKTVPSFLVAVLSACLLFPIGCWITNRLLSFQPQAELKAYVSAPITVVNRHSSWMAFWLPFFAVCAFVSLIFLSKLSSIPILALLMDNPNPEEFASLRESATANFGGKYHRYSLFFQYLMPVAASFALLLGTVTKRFIWRFLAMASGLFCAFMLIASGQKAPVMFFLLSLGSIYIWTSDHKRAFKLIVGGVTAATLLITLLYFLLYLRSDSTVDSENSIASRLFLMIGRRIFYGQTTSLYLTFEVFPFMHEYLLGKSIPNPASILPHKPFLFATYLFDIQLPFSPVRGSAPTVFYGEVFANFGWIVMLLSQLLVGMVLQFFHVWFVRHDKSVMTITAMITFAFLLAQVSLTSAAILLVRLPGAIMFFFCAAIYLKLADRYLSRISQLPCHT